METLNKPRILYRHHGYGNVEKVRPYITKYKTEEDYVRAVKYNLLHRPSHTLFSDTEVLNLGTLKQEQAALILNRIKQGEFNSSTVIPRSAKNLYTH